MAKQTKKIRITNQALSIAMIAMIAGSTILSPMGAYRVSASTLEDIPLAETIEEALEMDAAREVVESVVTEEIEIAVEEAVEVIEKEEALESLVQQTEEAIELQEEAQIEEQVLLEVQKELIPEVVAEQQKEVAEIQEEVQVEAQEKFNTIGTISDIFLDDGLANAIANTLGKSPTDYVSKGELLHITVLDAGGTLIRDLDGLQHLTNLEQLSLRNNLRISDISGLSNLINL